MTTDFGRPKTALMTSKSMPIAAMDFTVLIAKFFSSLNTTLLALVTKIAKCLAHDPAPLLGLLEIA